MSEPDYVEEFLRAFSASYEWEFVDKTTAMRNLCERYVYSPRGDRDLLMTCFGWIWGKTGCEVTGNCYAGLLLHELNKVYAEVAKEHNWGND